MRETEKKRQTDTHSRVESQKKRDIRSKEKKRRKDKEETRRTERRDGTDGTDQKKARRKRKKEEKRRTRKARLGEGKREESPVLASTLIPSITGQGFQEFSLEETLINPP